MNLQILSKLHFLTGAKSQLDDKLERREAFPFQEQFTGPLPLRLERPAAEILAERLTESGPDSAPPAFIP